MNIIESFFPSEVWKSEIAQGILIGRARTVFSIGYHLPPPPYGKVWRHVWLLKLGEEVLVTSMGRG
jgi:hypothetical protein